MERRSFLKSLCAFLGALAVAVFGYPLARFLAPPRAAAVTEKLAIDKSDIPPGTSKEIMYDGTPVIVINHQVRLYLQ